MRLICAATVEEDLQRKNLCDCICILGGVPNISGKTVSMEYEGEQSQIDKFIELFRQYLSHEIHTRNY